MCGSQGTNTTVNQSQPPAQVLQNYGALTSAAQNLVQQPQQQYGGSLVAGFTPDQQQAFQTVQNAQGIAQPYINAGAQEIGAATTPLWNGPVSGGDISNYESPYTADVTNTMQTLYNQENQQALQNVAGNATTHGAYGGDREAIAEGITQGQMTQGENANLAQVQQQGYNTALGEANTQQQTQLGANEANAWIDSQAGFGLAGLGTQAQQDALSGASAQLQTGADQQTLAQEQLSVPYEEFQAQQAYPYQQLQFLSGIDSAAAAGVGGTTTSTTAAPSGLSSLLGGGLAGYGIANGIGNNGISNSYLGTTPYGSSINATVNNSNSLLSNFDNEISNAVYKKGGRVHLDVGGIASATPVAGMNPNAQGVYSQIAQMPTEKLQELQARFPPNTPQGQALQRVIQQRHMNPNQDGIGAASQQVGASPAAAGIAAPTAPAPTMKDGGRARLATGGVGGAANATTFVVGGNGIKLPQVSNAVFAGPSASSVSSGSGLAGWNNPLPQETANGSPIVTPTSSAITSGIANPQNFKMPAPSSYMSNNSSGDLGGLGTLLGIGLSFLKDGGRAHYDDGGEVDDDADEATSAPTPSPTPAGIAAAPSASPIASASVVPDSASAIERGGFKPDWNKVLATAGLAMMAGKSPNASVNIGQGGLAALQDYDHQQQWDAQQQQRDTQNQIEAKRDAVTAQHFKDVDDKPVIDHSGPTIHVFYPSEKNADGSPKMIDLGIPTEAAQSAADTSAYRQASLGIDRAKLGIEQANADKTKFTFQPGMGQDPANPDDPTKQVAGSYVFNTTTGDTEFRPGVTLTAKAKPASAATSLTPAALDTAAVTFNTTGALPAFGMGGAEDKKAIMNHAAEMRQAAGIGDNDYLTSVAGVNAAKGALNQLTKQSALAESFSDTASKNGQLVLSLLDKGAGPTGVPVVDRWIQNGRSSVAGDPDVTALDTALATYKDENAKVLSGATGAAGITDAARNQVDALFNRASTPDQIRAAIATLDAERENRKTAYASQMTALQRRMGGQSTGATQPSPAPSGSQAQPTANPSVVIQNGWRYDAKTHQPLGPANQ